VQVVLQATQLLMHKLPCYSDLVAIPNAASVPADASPPGRQQPAWSSDTILATRVMLLMNALGACLPALPQVSWLPAVCLLACLAAVCLLEWLSAMCLLAWVLCVCLLGWLLCACLLAWLDGVCLLACLVGCCVMWACLLVCDVPLGQQERYSDANEVYLACKQCRHHMLPQHGEGVASVRVLYPLHA